MKPKVIFTAHDFGLCTSVNEGIIYCTEQSNSIISELSLLANAPGSIEAAEFAKATDISVSLNINLTTFSPISEDVPSLLNEKGEFRKVDLKDWDFSSIDRFDNSDIKKEIDAQWDWFIEHVGRKPSALLSRKNEHGDPKILMPFVEKAKLEGVPIRTPVWEWASNYGAQSYVTQEKVIQSDFVEIIAKDWFGRDGHDLIDDFDTLRDLMIKRKGVSELILFIGFVDEELCAITKLNWHRGIFLTRVANKSDVFDKIKNTFDIISYRDL